MIPTHRSSRLAPNADGGEDPEMHAPVPIQIAQAAAPDDVADVADLFRAYAASLDVDLCFQDFGAELAGLPGKYAPPRGALLLARSSGGEPLGCVAVRPLPEDGCCEMKRLYVSPAARGLGLGERLVGAALAAAERIGYREVRLDTLPSMTQAAALNRKVGIEPMPSYYETPVAGTLFMRRSLGGDGP